MFIWKIRYRTLIKLFRTILEKICKNRKFSLIVSNFGHEGTLKVIKYADNFISNFLWNLFNDNLLRNSTIFLVSDHGTGMPSLYYIDEFYRIETKLPMLYIFVSDKKNSSYEQQYKYIYENQQTFIIAYDIYNTFVHLLYGDNYNSTQHKEKPFFEVPKTSNGESLFLKINQKLRTPNIHKDMVKDVCIDNNNIN